MSTTIAPSLAPLSATRVTWAKVDSGFWVAHRGGEYYGCVDSVSGGFVSRDAHGIPIGRYDALDAAKASLRTTADPINTARRRRTERATAVLATTAGTAALAFALTAGALAPYL
ncbi:peptide ABC transporter permease [Microbacterium enclense]|uniref:peptide ABC transporter permease n=1 Tax=Microbacterium enclense TaxID=993073 RepID=UPI0021A8568B|nr:peptide ABC transporter permease [Microbacterium enclense]MCT2086397.1 peptide ABC transporter permease [Microbacterium enclense]